MTVAPPPYPKKVPEQQTLTVAANYTDFVAEIDRGLKRQGYITPREGAAAGGTRKDREILSHSVPAISQAPCNELKSLLSDRLSKVTVSADELDEVRTENFDRARPNPDSALGGLVDPHLAKARYDFLVGRWEQNDALKRTEPAAKVESLAARAARSVRDPDHVFYRPVPSHRPLIDGVTNPRQLGIDWRQRGADESERPMRSKMYEIRAGIRLAQKPRMQSCGRAYINGGDAVDIIASPDGGARYGGLAHCGSVWACPTCRMAILARRGDEVSTAVESHGGCRVGMWTLTIRHGRRDSLARLRKDLALAWSRFTRHRTYRRWKEETGLVGRITAKEVTHGSTNGWHPHLHVLFFFEEAVPLAYGLGADGSQVRTWDCPDFEKLEDLWIDCVAAIFPAANIPIPGVALKATLAHDAKYISKMGLELTDPGMAKRPKVGPDGEIRRTPMMIAADLAELAERIENGSGERYAGSPDWLLWRKWCEDIKGANKLVWSEGLKRIMNVVSVSDMNIVCEDDEVEATDTVVASIPVAVWKAIRDKYTCGVPVPLHLLQSYERGGPECLQKALLKVAAGEF